MCQYLVDEEKNFKFYMNAKPSFGVELERTSPCQKLQILAVKKSLQRSKEE